jgi:phage tail-like protein
MRPFTTFNFIAAFTLPDKKDEVCEAEFSECDGLEMTMEVKTIREGGNNAQQLHLAGPVSYGQLTLKRGMTKNFDIWDWFEAVQSDRRLRVNGEVQMLASKLGEKERAKNVVFTLTGCVPVKVRAPSLNASEGVIAIEELAIAYETLTQQRPAAQ